MALKLNDVLRQMTGILVIGCASVASAMTYNDFKAALSSAEEGDTVYLENDVVYDSALPEISTRVTITSPEGQTNVLLRSKSYGGSLLTISDVNADVTLKNVIFDGNKAAGRAARSVIVLSGKLTLEEGSIWQNFNFLNTPGGFMVGLDGELYMRDGAVIRNCDFSYYALLLIGTRTTKGISRDGYFEMTGGLITGCRGTWDPSDGVLRPDYDGMVYVYSWEKSDMQGVHAARFVMSGGEITGNTSQTACAGVCNVCGRFELSGTARIFGNKGGMVDDIYIADGRGESYLANGYAGRATIYYSSKTTPPNYQASAGRIIYPLTPMPHFRGAENISNQHWPDWVLTDDYGGTYSVFYWEPLAAIVDGTRYAYVSFDKAFKAIRNGSDICIMTNYEFKANYPLLVVSNDWSVTFRGRADKPVRFTRSGVSGSFANLFSNSSLRVENLIIDGKGDSFDIPTVKPSMMFSMAEGASLTLGTGAVISNFVRHASPVLVSLNAAGQVLTIEDGATITSCGESETEAYGTLFRVGNNSAFDPPPRLEMTGGLITNCWSGCTLAASGGYGGMIYLQKGIFNMSGGTIAGNRCGNAEAGSCAGVQAYQGTMNITGSARIENNTGMNPDLFHCGGNTVNMTGDFRGRVGLSSGNQTDGQETVIKIDAGATGAWGFFPAANGSDTSLVGTPNDAGTKVKWAARTGAIDGVAFATDAEARILWPAEKTITLENLPHIFSGSALALSGTITFDFATDDVLSTYAGPITFLVAEGGIFTGDWTFNVPTAPRAKWYVRKTTSAGGITSYYLEYAKKGTTLIFR